MQTFDATRSPQGLSSITHAVLVKHYHLADLTDSACLTEMAKTFEAQAPAAFDAYKGKIMLKRMANPEDLNGSILFLLSDASSFITGEDILVDGGQCHL